MRSNSKLPAYLPNKTYHSLTSIRFMWKTGNYAPWWEFQCACGKVVVRNYSEVKQGKTKHCGCLTGINVGLAHARHGHSGSRFYECWKNMKRRCNPSKKHKGYHNYAGRGIKVCDKWQIFEGFLEDMLKGYKPDLTLERKDNDKGYFLENCCWADKKAQARNRRVNIKVIYKGKEYTLCELAAEYGMSPRAVRVRHVVWKWPLERALLEPVNTWKNRTKALPEG